MPLDARRPNLPALLMPGSTQSNLTVEDVHTPHTPTPFTPASFKQGPMVMTPDTPSFDRPPLEILVGGQKSNSEKTLTSQDVEPEWTDDEDGLLQSYLAHPPRALRDSYPPGTLPPSSTLDKITAQLFSSEMRKSPPVSTSSHPAFLSLSDDNPTPTGLPTSNSWRHSWAATRARLFVIARKESIESTGGHRRKESDSIIPPASQVQYQRPEPELEDVRMRPSRPRLAVLGSQKMNRQQHSMDSLYGDDEQPQTFSEALRLSSALQVNAQGDNSVLHSGCGLSSPLAFSFNLSPLNNRKPFPYSAPTSYMPRPSLLQRGRSFTSEDFAREHAKAAGEETDYGADDDVDADSRPGYRSPKITVRPEMHRSVSSPASTLDSSPPSSISSRSEDFELDSEVVKAPGGLLEVTLGDFDVDVEPTTPVNRIFSSLALKMGGPLGSQCTTPTVSSTPLNPPPIVQPRSPAPAITLTVNSPEREGGKRDSTVPRLANASPSEAFATLSLDSEPSSSSSSLPLALPFTTSTTPSMVYTKPKPQYPMLGQRKSPSTGEKRSSRPPHLHRSLSEGTTNNAGRAGSRPFGGLSMTSLSAERDRESKRQRAMGMGLGLGGLSVVLPQRLGGGGMGEELRSPFEIKKAFC